MFGLRRFHNSNDEQSPKIKAEAPCTFSQSWGDESQQCAERKLFQSWQQAAQDESKPGDIHEANEETHGARILRQSFPQSKTHNSTMQAVPSHVVKEWLAEVATLLHESTLQPELNTQAKLNRLFSQTLDANKTNATSTKWSQDLEALQDKMQAQLQQSHHHLKQFQTENAHFMELFNRTADAIHQGSSSHWVQDLQKTKDLLESRMKALRQKHHTLRGNAGNRNSTVSVMVDLHAHMQAVYENLPSIKRTHLRGTQHQTDEPLTPFARELVQDQKKLEAEMGALRGSHHKHKRNTTTEEKPLIDRIAEFGHQLCVHPKRKYRPECAEFIQTAGSSHNEDTHPEALLSHREWDTKLAGEITSLTQELCEDPSRRDHASCARFRIHAAQPPKSGLRGAQQYLDWGSVISWKATPRSGLRGSKGSTERKVLTRAQLKHAKWQGHAPKVACITAISAGRDARARMKYFIDNFNLQNYEGDRELIIVYHHEDSEARRLVQAVADGDRIRGVATRTHEKMPSTLALRFGAWVATDADVIARWDFNDYHHPQRLSMQVRALAMSSRPASLLTAATSDFTDLSTAHEHGFLVGETRWMHEHWYPLLEEEAAVLKGAEASHLVVVDMPELDIHADR